MKSLLIVAFILLLTSTMVFAQDSTTFMEQAWHTYQSGRICYTENKVGPDNVNYNNLITCLEVQSQCKLIYDGIYMDERRRWIAESKPVKKYLTNMGLKPINYCEIVRLMSKGHMEKN